MLSWMARRVWREGKAITVERVNSLLQPYPIQAWRQAKTLRYKVRVTANDWNDTEEMDMSDVKAELAATESETARQHRGRRLDGVSRPV